MTERRILVAALAAVFACGIAAAQDKPTFAERLGWPKGSKVVIFHCDDAGMSHSSNLGAIEALEKGVVTSVSTMMPCAWVPEFADYLKKHPDVDNGIHATFTSEWDFYRWQPLAGVDVVPGLVDEKGYMHDNVGLVVENATPDEFEKELRTQIAYAEKMGIPITHIDTHMGTVYATPEFFERYMKVGIEKNIPIMIPGGHLTHAKTEFGEEMGLLGDIPEQVWAAGLPVLDDLHGESYGWRSYEEDKAGFINYLRNMPPGITQIIVHCTRPTDEFASITPSGPTRLGDLLAVTDPEVKKVIEEEGIILSTWRELKERRDKVGK